MISKVISQLFSTNRGQGCGHSQDLAAADDADLGT